MGRGPSVRQFWGFSVLMRTRFDLERRNRRGNTYGNGACSQEVSHVIRFAQMRRAVCQICRLFFFTHPPQIGGGIKR